MQNFAQNADAQDTAATRAAKSAIPCHCGNYTDAETGARLVCVRETAREFAPGHDAKLKGFLIRAGAAGHAVKVLGRPGTVTAQEAADWYGFGHLVAQGIKRAQDREFAKLLRETTKQAKKTHETPRVVSCKVGRWFYDGVVTDSPEHGPQFTFTRKDGTQQTTTKFTRV